jgi:YidC/Oxa1 family membrane protein insertase
MKNRNTLYFILGTILLFAGYWFVMTRYYPQPTPVQPPVQVALPPTQAPVAAAPAATVAAPVQEGRTFSLQTAELDLTWRVSDGALVQARWRADANPTAFFPSHRTDDKGQILAQAFPGIGGTRGAAFEGDPQVLLEGGQRTVVFRNGAGDRLAYRVPEGGHVLEVAWTSPSAAPMALLRQPTNLLEVAGLGGIFTLQDKSFETVTWTDMMKDPLLSWFGAKRKVLPAVASRLGMDAGVSAKMSQTHYFAAIWEVDRLPGRDAATGYQVAPDPGGTIKARLYLGPKQMEALAAFGKPFMQVVDFGFWGAIAKLMFWSLRAIQRFIPNWGWTLVIFSVLIRLALWSLNTKSTVQMLRMKDMEPHQKAIQAKYEKFGNDMTKKAEMQKELMAFYKKNGHNPMGGCWPMLVQMPVFFALWSMINNVYELRHAPWMFWIKDLSAPDPIYILPVLMGVAMLVQSKMTPAMGDPMQRKMMTYMMPAMMVFFFATTPAGLCVYYLVFNLVHLFQTWVLLRNYRPQPVVV